MTDFFEIDFLSVESDKSGDAIALRYSHNGVVLIHVVDAGFQATGESVVSHIRQHYGNPRFIDHVVATHHDGDHSGGLRSILESFHVGCLWMHRPWLYAKALLPKFARFTTEHGLASRLRDAYPNLAALESIALDRGIRIQAPLQGAVIGQFVVLSPSEPELLDLVLASEKTPAQASLEQFPLLRSLQESAGSSESRQVSAAWGKETFSQNETSSENEMSVVQYAYLAGKRILLTGDVGRAGLISAADFAQRLGISLPGIDRFQVPHHGSRRNVSSEVLDRWLGSRLSGPEDRFHAFISSAKADKHHPRNSVVRAIIHRGGRVYATEGRSLRTSINAPARSWTSVEPVEYPTMQEE